MVSVVAIILGAVFCFSAVKTYRSREDERTARSLQMSADPGTPWAERPPSPRAIGRWSQVGFVGGCLMMIYGAATVADGGALQVDRYMVERLIMRLIALVVAVLVVVVLRARAKRRQLTPRDRQ
jgi:uncharacterized membrane protein YdjX (TVP38/TMEM64 family)